MGGCKCSYRSCSRTSDGKTHFFHYPTKDAKRRHQWVINANRLDLLELTQAQLKNKVVCEYHFSENMFMNYKHERLIHNAVPNKEVLEEKYAATNITSIPDDDTGISIQPELSEVNTNVVSTTTDIMPVDKDCSTMMVNVSPITGLSFLTPIEKKQNAPPFIELFTRVYNKGNAHIVKKGDCNISVVSKSTKNSQTCNTENLNQFKDTGKNLVDNDSNLNKQKIVFSHKAPVETLYLKKAFKTNSDLGEDKTFNNVIQSSQGVSTTENQIINKNVGEVCKVLLNEKSPKKSCLSTKVKNKVEKEIKKDKRVLFETNSTNIQNLHITNQITSESISSSNISIIDIPADKFIQDGDIISVDSEGRGKLSLDFVLENSTQTEDTTTIKCNELLNENFKVINELKSLIKKEKHSREVIQKRLALKRSHTGEFKPLSKAILYAQIVPYLSPELARMVHKEMFPSMRHVHRM